MKLHYIQHVPFEEPGIIKTWAERKEIQVTCTKLFADEKLPATEEIDWLLIMGGPMSVYDEILYPWLIEEKAFVKSVIEAGKIVIGICLGAQMIADVLGARVYKNTYKEIGWFPVKKVLIGTDNIFMGLPDEFLAFHWHGETFDLPEGAVHIALSEACKNQAFLYKKNVLGLQFHMEMNEKNVELIVKNCKKELVPGKYIQNEEEILSTGKVKFSEMNGYLENILDSLLNKETFQ